LRIASCLGFLPKWPKTERKLLAPGIEIFFHFIFTQPSTRYKS
jgi:hypothetical protein